MFLSETSASSQHALAGSNTFDPTAAERTEDARIAMLARWIGDLDGVGGRGFLRMAVNQERVSLVYEGPEQRGDTGPGSIRKARARAATMGLVPNVWFGHVEVAAGRTIRPRAGRLFAKRPEVLYELPADLRGADGSDRQS